MSYLAPLLVFGLVIFVHELGHFIAAKLMGVYAPRFSVGFGPALLRFRRGETEYILAALPLGGYVRMASRLDEETAFLEGGSEEKVAAEQKWVDPNAMIPFGPNPVPPDRWFESKSLPARLFIMIAGVTMNAILAFVLYTVLEMRSGRQTILTTVVGSVPVIADAPELARVQRGDTIRAVNGRPVASWNDVFAAFGATGSRLEIVTHRDSVSIPVRAPETLQRIATDLVYFVPPVIDSVIAGDPAAAAGIQRGDSVAAVNGQPITLWSELVERVSASPGRPVTFDIVRAGVPQTVSITPVPRENADPQTGKVDTVGRIGVAPLRNVRTETVGFMEAIRLGAVETWTQGTGIVRTVKQLVTGDVSMRQLGGPIAITRVSVSAAQLGWERLVGLIALISINLAVLNLLPIPILDGGQILINILESIKGRPFSMRTREYILRFGLVAIGLLFVTVMYNDTRGGFARLFQWISERVGGG